MRPLSCAFVILTSLSSAPGSFNAHRPYTVAKEIRDTCHCHPGTIGPLFRVTRALHARGHFFNLEKYAATKEDIASPKYHLANNISHKTKSDSFVKNLNDTGTWEIL